MFLSGYSATRPASVDGVMWLQGESVELQKIEIQFVAGNVLSKYVNKWLYGKPW